MERSNGHLGYLCEEAEYIMDVGRIGATEYL